MRYDYKRCGHLFLLAAGLFLLLLFLIIFLTAGAFLLHLRPPRAGHGAITLEIPRCI